MSLDLLAALLEAVVGAHTPRALVRAIASALHACRIPVVHVSLGEPVVAAAALVSGEWRDTPTPAAQLLCPGLACTLQGRPPPYFTDAAYRRALAAVVATALDHMAVVQRVAQLSRKAHVEARELRLANDRLDGATTVVARSAAMRDVLARAALVAKHATTVLVTGESGSGKEVLAREIHRLSPRAHRPLLAVNCGAIPDGLVESELFGHERGAFSGAERRHLGVFERAHRGTLFLDEIGELSPAAQAKLLRVLQDGSFRRVGGTDPIATDVRLIAATNRSLPAMVRAGNFREDLFYRLHVFAIPVPPLRERRDDIAPLAGILVKHLAARLGLDAPPPPISRAVLAQLEAHDWPGNVRELANVLEAALIVSDGRRLELPSALATPPVRHDDQRFDAAAARAIETALRAARGKIYGHDGAAARLGLKPATLQSKMKKLGIERLRFAR